MKKTQKKQQQEKKQIKVETEEAPTKRRNKQSNNRRNKQSRNRRSTKVEETNAKSNSNAQPRETERTHVVDTVAKDLYNKSEVTEAEKVKLKSITKRYFKFI